jgi:hypothetical protein
MIGASTASGKYALTSATPLSVPAILRQTVDSIRRRAPMTWAQAAIVQPIPRAVQ